MNHCEYPPFELWELSYQILLNSETKKFKVIQIQDIDDFDKELLLKDSDGLIYRFEVTKEGKQQARELLNKVINPEFIDEDDLIANNENMYKIPQEEWDKA